MVVFVILHVQNLVIFRNFNKPPSCSRLVFSLFSRPLWLRSTA